MAYVILNTDGSTLLTLADKRVDPSAGGNYAIRHASERGNVEVIKTIAKKHHLKVIYEASHCFGVTYKGKSIFNYGLL